MTQISERLRHISLKIAYTPLADIGTDHALLPIHAVSCGIISSAIAVDVRPGPLECARTNIGQVKGIDLRLGSGLSVLKPGEAETIVISGMGGALICSILSAGADVAMAAKQLILAPQASIPLVRKLAHELGFCIFDEEILLEYGNFYHIIDIRTSKDPNFTRDKPYTPTEYELGRCLMKKRSSVFLRYAQHMAKRCESTACEISKSQSLESKSKLADVLALRNIYKNHEGDVW